MKKKYKDSDFFLCGDDVNSESPKTIEVTCKLIDKLSPTGRSISSKLVISKNKFPNGENCTIVMRESQNHQLYNRNYYLFIPINDIYLNYNKTDLIMPRGKPVYVMRHLNSEIIPSRKYPHKYVFAPDSDIETIFKEINLPKYGKIWVLTYEKATLHLMRHYIGPTGRHAALDELYKEENYEYIYVSKHLENRLKENEFRNYDEESEDEYRSLENLRDAQSMTDDLFEEAGYDFMD